MEFGPCCTSRLGASGEVQDAEADRNATSERSMLFRIGVNVLIHDGNGFYGALWSNTEALSRPSARSSATVGSGSVRCPRTSLLLGMHGAVL